MENLLKGLTAFLGDFADVIGLYGGDLQENIIAMKKALSLTSPQSTKSIYKARCKIIVSIPNQLQALHKKGAF